MAEADKREIPPPKFPLDFPDCTGIAFLPLADFSLAIANIHKT